MNNLADTVVDKTAIFAGRPFRANGIGFAIIGAFFLFGFIYTPFTEPAYRGQTLGLGLFELYTVPSLSILVLYGIHLSMLERFVSPTAIVEQSRFKTRSYALSEIDSLTIVKYGNDNAQEMCVVRGCGRRFVFTSADSRYSEILEHLSAAIKNVHEATVLKKRESGVTLNGLPGIPAIKAITVVYVWALGLMLILAFLKWGAARDDLALSDRLDKNGVAVTGRIVKIYAAGLCEYEFAIGPSLIQHRFSRVPEPSAMHLRPNGPATVIYLPEHPHVNRLRNGMERERAEFEMHCAEFCAIGSMIFVPVMIWVTRRAWSRLHPKVGLQSK